MLKTNTRLIEKSVLVSTMILFSALFFLASTIQVHAWEVHNKAFSDPNNVETDAVEMIDGIVYWGTSNVISGAKVWSYDGVDYDQITADGFGDPDNRIITDIVSFNGNIIVSTYNRVGTEIWEFDGMSWTQINVNGFGDASSYFADVLIVYEGDLYAATYNGSSNGVVWRYDSGLTWTQVSTGGFGGNNRIWAGEIFQDNMYIATSNPAGGELWRYDGGSTWTQIASGGIDDLNNRSLRGLYSFGDSLYITSQNSVTGTEVWTYDGSDFNQINSDGFGSAVNINIEEKGIAYFEGAIYFGVSNSVTGAELWKLSEGVFSNINIGGTHNIDNGTFSAAAVLANCIYYGSGNLIDGTEIIRTCTPTAIEDRISITDTINSIDINILDNDLYDDLDPRSITITSQPMHGSVSINSDNSIRYDILGVYSGEDTFEYQICNFDGFCSVTQVTISVSSTETLANSGLNTVRFVVLGMLGIGLIGVIRGRRLLHI